MKFLLALIMLSLIGCTKEPGGHYTGKIVEMKYSGWSRHSNRIEILVGNDIKFVHDSPYFWNLNIGETVEIACAAGYYSKCYILARKK